jgi:hypothetical protein
MSPVACSVSSNLLARRAAQRELAALRPATAKCSPFLRIHLEEAHADELHDRTPDLPAGCRQGTAALAGKRVIGGRETMSFNLLSLRYGWAYELYRAMKANHGA